MKCLLVLTSAVLIWACSDTLVNENGNKQSDKKIKLTLVTRELMAPVAMDCPKDGSGRIFICEQTGAIKIFKDGKLNEKPFLELKNKVDHGNPVYSEKGLLSIAFHPQYKTNGRFFIYYSTASNNKISDHKSILSEFKVSSNADEADASSEKIIMEIEQPESNHNGGQIAFGPDGFLYVGLGDGGGQNDKHGKTGNGQDLGSVLGKILRIDVNDKKPYGIPTDNPLVNDKNAKAEIWAYGFRNPWRFSFDRKTGKLFCGDVGQDDWEEVDLVEKGKNYGWRIMEGNHCHNPEKNCSQENLVLPIGEYNHKEGVCIIGGYVYRGKKAGWLDGKYIFGDWKGTLYFLEQKGENWSFNNLSIEGKKDNDADLRINSFGEDENGELYILGQQTTGTVGLSGEIYRIE